MSKLRRNLNKKYQKSIIGLHFLLGTHNVLLKKFLKIVVDYVNGFMNEKCGKMHCSESAKFSFLKF